MRARTTLPACVVQFACAIALLPHLFHRTRSHLLELILLGSLVLAGFRTATLWMLVSAQDLGPTEASVVALQTTTTALYAISAAVVSWSSLAADGESEPNHTQSDLQPVAPREKDASFASLVFLAWLNPLLSAGQKRENEILQSDMERIQTHPSSAFFPSTATDEQKKNTNDQSFVAQLVRDIPMRTHLSFLWALVLAGLTAATTLCQPLIIGALVVFLQRHDHSSVGAWLVVALFLE